MTRIPRGRRHAQNVDVTVGAHDVSPVPEGRHTMPTVNEAEIRRHLEALRRADAAALSEILADDFVQEWPQSGERVRGAQACLAVAQAYPGGMPVMDIGRITGEGDHWVVQGKMHYPDGSEYLVATLLEFAEGKLQRETDYFGPPFPAPEWRASLVERFEATPV
jgi:ketosteroid isomerase-like protein